MPKRKPSTLERVAEQAGPSRRCALACLSVEEWEEVFKHVRQHSAVDLRNCLITCRRFYHVGSPIICQDIVITDSNLSTFVNAFNPRFAMHVRSLSFDLVSPSSGRYKVTDPFSISDWDIDTEAERYVDDLENIAELLPLLFQMQTFSFKWDSLVEDCAFPKYGLTVLIRNLPESVINLEIDVSGYERHFIHRSDPQHACSDLRKIIPRLRNLRLRMNFLCPDLFGGFDSFSAPRLERVLITGNLTTLWPTAICQIGLYPVHAGLDPREARAALLPHLQRLLDSGAFPKIKEFVFLDHRNRRGLGPQQYSAIVLRDLVRNITVSIPYISGTLHGESGWVRDKACIVRSPDGRELCGSMKAWHDQVEGEAGWITTAKGFRFPRHAEFVRNQIRDGYKIQEMPWHGLEITDEYLLRAIKHLSEREHQVGMKLLETETRDGVLEDRPHMEILPFGYTYDGSGRLVPHIMGAQQQ